jgi:hypothetical protein
MDVDGSAGTRADNRSSGSSVEWWRGASCANSDAHSDTETGGNSGLRAGTALKSMIYRSAINGRAAAANSGDWRASVLLLSSPGTKHEVRGGAGASLASVTRSELLGVG